MRFLWARRLFGTWTEFCDYLVFVSVGVAGLAGASWLWPLIGAMVLLLIDWERYRELFVKADKIDAQYRELARLAHRIGHVQTGLGLYVRARALAIVLIGKLGLDALFLVGAFVFGQATRWVWSG